VTSSPLQAWAHRQGRVAMRPLEPADFGPEALSARARIADAFHRFAVAHDEAQFAQLASCFTEDAVFEVAEGSAEAFERFDGRTRIQERLSEVVAEQGDQRRHLMGNVLVEELDLTAGAATAIAFGLVSVAADTVRWGASVIYHARLRREPDGCWRFCAFFVGMDAYVGDKPVMER